MKINLAEGCILGGTILICVLLGYAIMQVGNRDRVKDDGAKLPAPAHAPAQMGEPAPAEDCYDRSHIKAVIDDILKLKGIEMRFVGLAVKMDENNCDCSEEERKLILQLKLFDAIKRDNPEKAEAYLDSIFRRVNDDK